MAVTLGSELGSLCTAQGCGCLDPLSLTNPHKTLSGLSPARQLHRHWSLKGGGEEGGLCPASSGLALWQPGAVTGGLRQEAKDWHNFMSGLS